LILLGETEAGNPEEEPARDNPVRLIIAMRGALD
jgi:hypothetical protein